MGGCAHLRQISRPKSDKPLPLVLQFHGYPGASRSWLEQSSFAGMGYALLAMDCPGQGGKSQDIGGFLGTTVSGHLIAGLDGEPKDMYYVRLYQNIRILCRIVRQMKDIDQRRIYINGASQGAGARHCLRGAQSRSALQGRDSLSLSERFSEGFRAGRG